MDEAKQFPGVDGARDRGGRPAKTTPRASRNLSSAPSPHESQTRIVWAGAQGLRAASRIRSSSRRASTRAFRTIASVRPDACRENDFRENGKGPRGATGPVRVGAVARIERDAAEGGPCPGRGASPCQGFTRSRARPSTSSTAANPAPAGTAKRVSSPPSASQRSPSRGRIRPRDLGKKGVRPRQGSRKRVEVRAVEGRAHAGAGGGRFPAPATTSPHHPREFG